MQLLHILQWKVRAGIYFLQLEQLFLTLGKSESWSSDSIKSSSSGGIRVTVDESKVSLDGSDVPNLLSEDWL